MDQTDVVRDGRNGDAFRLQFGGRWTAYQGHEGHSDIMLMSMTMGNAPATVTVTY